jgi:hypothetical protein
LHSTKWSNGKKKKGWKPLSLKKKSMQDSVGNEENGYPVSDSNKTIINVTKEPRDAYKKKKQKKKPSKWRSWKKSLRNSWRRH